MLSFADCIRSSETCCCLYAGYRLKCISFGHMYNGPFWWFAISNEWLVLCEHIDLCHLPIEHEHYSVTLESYDRIGRTTIHEMHNYFISISNSVYGTQALQYGFHIWYTYVSVCVIARYWFELVHTLNIDDFSTVRSRSAFTLCLADTHYTQLTTTNMESICVEESCFEYMTLRIVAQLNHRIAYCYFESIDG